MRACPNDCDKCTRVGCSVCCFCGARLIEDTEPQEPKMTTPTPKQTETEKCRLHAASIAARHVPPGFALEAATADIARELEAARAGAVRDTFAAAGAGFEKSTFEGAQRCLKKASLDAAMFGDLRTSLGLMAVGLLVKTVQDSVHPAPAGAQKP